MPKSKSKSRPSARVVSSGALPKHPALNSPDPLLSYRMGAEESLRLPDHIVTATASKVLRDEYDVTTDATGSAVIAESFGISTSRCSWPITAGVTGTVVTSQHPQFAAFNSEAYKARMVAFKIQLTYTGAEQTTSGYISYVRRYNVTEANGVSVSSLHTGSEVQMRNGETVTFYVPYEQLPEYAAPSATSFMDGTYSCPIFVISGAEASKTIYRVRVCRFMEYLPKEGSLSEGDTKIEPFNPAALSTHGQLSATTTSVHRSSDSSFIPRLKAAANMAYHIVQPMLPYAVPYARQALQAALTTAAPLLLGA